MIDRTFTNINRLFILSFKNSDNDVGQDSYDNHYLPLVEIKNFNVLIDNKPFFEQPIKNKQVYEKLVKMSKNDDYTVRTLLDY